MIPGTQGYAENATALSERYEGVAFALKHQAVWQLLPDAPVATLDIDIDIGAGTGADTYSLATGEHRVVAVEPTAAFTTFGAAKHPSALIEWVNDSLPLLDAGTSGVQRFGLIMLAAVWMHLDKQEREIAMPVLAQLIAPSGVIVMVLRRADSRGPRLTGRTQRLGRYAAAATYLGLGFVAAVSGSRPSR